MSTLSWSRGYSLGRIAELACLLEVTAAKPGNVHRGADFDDVSFIDFVSSAVALGQAIDESEASSYGATVLAVARRTLAVTPTNTNLGMNLLLSALSCAAVEINGPLTVPVMQSWTNTIRTGEASKVYEAIRLMKPGGIGTVDSNDVSGEPERSLIDTMAEAADRDDVAAQFGIGFRQVIEDVPREILAGQIKFGSLLQGIVYAHVSLMAVQGDSLIARKSGVPVSEKAQAMSARAIESFEGDGDIDAWWRSIGDLDFWLRSDGRNRNPGTTADLMAAGIFVAIYNERIKPPFA